MGIAPSNLRAPVALIFSLIGVFFTWLAVSPAATNEVRPVASELQRPSLGPRPGVQTGFNSNALYGVTCVSASDCWAVGLYGETNKNLTLTEHWDGSSWAIVPSANIMTTVGGSSTAASGTLNRVACNSTSDCWAVGDGGSQTLIEHWDGAKWSLLNSQDATQVHQLSGLACNSSSDCWTVGNITVNGQEQTLAKHWGGIAWSTVPTPNVSTNQSNRLTSVACNSPSDCWAVGRAGNAALFEHWDGMSWSIVSSPSTTSILYLYDVACVSTSQCWAVGNLSTGSTGATLIEKWDGSSWAIVNSPSPVSGGTFTGVTCVSASDCWAVGRDSIPHPLIEHWDGSSWAIVNAAPNGGVPWQVACGSASDCWGTHQLAQHWNGNNWSALPTAPAFAGVISRFVQTGFGPADIHLPDVECRRGLPDGNYQLIFSFWRTLTSVDGAVTNAGTVGAHSFGPGANQYTVNLAGILNSQYVTVTLQNVHDEGGNFGNVSTKMAVLVGDTTGEGQVNATDVAQTKLRAGASVTSGNFRSDVNASGSINSTDVSIVKSSAGSGLP